MLGAEADTAASSSSRTTPIVPVVSLDHLLPLSLRPRYPSGRVSSAAPKLLRFYANGGPRCHFSDVSPLSVSAFLVSGFVVSGFVSARLVAGFFTVVVDAAERAVAAVADSSVVWTHAFHTSPPTGIVK